MSSSPFTPAFNNLVNDQLKKWHCPGVSISVFHGDKTWDQVYGLAQLDPPKPVESSTLFYGASTTKAQLCALWAIFITSPENQAKGKDKFTFSTPLADIIRDDFVLPDPVRTLQVTRRRRIPSQRYDET